MPSRFCSLALALALALGASGLPACVPPAADYTESEWNKNLRLDAAPAQLTLGFQPGSSHILPGDLARLRAIAASAGIVPSDRVAVAVAGAPSLAAARFEAVAASLLSYGIVASPAALIPAPPDAAVIRRERYVVTVPPCPDWSKPAAGAGDFTNSASSNFGCASATNLGLMVATPADLIEARQVALTDAHPAAEAVNNYRLGKVQLPVAANIGPIAAPANPTLAAPGTGTSGSGAGGSGAQP
jgi:pilus assembly protein CpaD